MGWMQKLYETYENCRSLVGVKEGELPPLMPIYHTTQQAHVEAVIDTDGCWRTGRAKVLADKKDRVTLIPCTEQSSARTSGPVPHPLFDGLKYIAGDYGNYRDPKDSHYAEYIEQLSAWCGSPYAHPKVRAVLEYLKKGTLMADLIRDNILYQEESGRLPESWDGKKEDAPPIFKVCAKDQADAFVRFQVISADGAEDLQSRPWEDETVWKSFIDYQNSLQTDRDYCYVLGKEMPVSSLSPKYIRRPGDGAKLISANDGDGFTYRGRFETPSQAFRVGRETTEKAHNALKWLIPRQAFTNGDQVILAWGTDGGKGLDPCEGALDLLFDLEPDPPPVTTGEEFAARFTKATAGYGGNLKGWEDMCVIGLDSATPGRLSVFYYREMQAKDLVTRVKSWHDTCSWELNDFPRDAWKTGEKTRPMPFRGAPSPKSIVKAAYGSRVDDKLMKSAVQRLLPCIVDGASLPEDLMHCAARRASNPEAIDKKQENYQNTLGIACALIRKFHNDRINRKQIKDETYREVWTMALNPEENDRSYLFGRALAYAQQIEGYSLGLSEASRSTNAERVQAAFSQHPAKAWKTLYHQLLPYLQKLGDRGKRYREELNEVISRIPLSEFSNAPLSEIYLLGYACQMQKFHEDKQENIRKKMEAAENSIKGEENK
ncbi:type I-C CRISPR-associated protein Cas8c/Csd1 [Caproiciproducens sp. R1]|uniref:type I-C CRISPR-associated protein Cas8c/Csd1 n=1 Tax=Caproiciproducens sp. R1 TaxID=3435000 RepID=UPI0040342B57